LNLKLLKDMMEELKFVAMCNGSKKKFTSTGSTLELMQISSTVD